MVILFDTEFVEHSKIPDHVLEYADFIIRTDPMHQGDSEYFLVGLSSHAAAGLNCRNTIGHECLIAYLESKLAANVHRSPRRDRLGFVRSAGDNC